MLRCHSFRFRTAQNKAGSGISWYKFRHQLHVQGSNRGVACPISCTETISELWLAGPTARSRGCMYSGDSEVGGEVGGDNEVYSYPI